jgi:kanamycin kinase/aminoglycoside 3'-phosphotransferase-3
MKEVELPEKIYHLISDEKYLTDEVGMSEASVLMFKDKVLKIQKCSEEAENEYHIPTC